MSGESQDPSPTPPSCHSFETVTETTPEFGGTNEDFPLFGGTRGAAHRGPAQTARPPSLPSRFGERQVGPCFAWRCLSPERAWSAPPGLRGKKSVWVRVFALSWLSGHKRQFARAIRYFPDVVRSSPPPFCPCNRINSVVQNSSYMIAMK